MCPQQCVLQVDVLDAAQIEPSENASEEMKHVVHAAAASTAAGAHARPREDWAEQYSTIDRYCTSVLVVASVGMRKSPLKVQSPRGGLHMLHALQIGPDAQIWASMMISNQRGATADLSLPAMPLGGTAPTAVLYALHPCR